MASLEREREAEQEALPKIPNLGLANKLFICTQLEQSSTKFGSTLGELNAAIDEGAMAPFYQHVCAQLKLSVDKQKLALMQKQNEAKIEELDRAVKEAEETAGDTEIKDARLAKAEYLCTIGDKNLAVEALDVCFKNAMAIGYHKLDVMFYKIRMGMFYMDCDLMSKSIATCKELVDRAGDWDRRNRLKIYEGTYALRIRDFTRAAPLFLESLSTFTSYELMDYTSFVSYTVVSCMFALSRQELKKKVVDAAEIIEVFHRIPYIEKFMTSFYKCQYKDFFTALAEIETHLKNDRILHHHYRHYVNEMRIQAYTQMLHSYQSVTISSVASAFGVSESFIDSELSRYIAAGRLSCKIDKVHGIVEMNRKDIRNQEYRELVQNGDSLLNRVQKLSRVIDI